MIQVINNKYIYLLIFIVIINCHSSRKSQLMTFHGNKIIWKKNYVPIALIYGITCKNASSLIYSIERASISNNVFKHLFTYPIQWTKDEPIVAFRGTAFFHCINRNEFDNDKTLAKTFHNIESDAKTIGSVDVLISEQDNYDLMFYIVLHELGHVLGLSHDRNEQSIMYPYVNGTIEYHDRNWEIEDMNILTELYCK